VNPLLKIENISKQYNIVHKNAPYQTMSDLLRNLFKKTTSKEQFYALKDISFNVNEGEAVGIIGKNGAGKSTLLKILSRITFPTSGKITYRGRIASLLEVGTGFHPELTGRENIFLNGSILGLKRKEIIKNFDAIVDFSGVEKFLDTPLKHYSSGMQLRLAFSVAAHLYPEILVIDEVLAVGDAEFQKKCFGKMDEVSKGGRTILFVSHNMAAIEKLCTKVVLLHKGRLVTMGDPNTVITKYLNVKSKSLEWTYVVQKNLMAFFQSIRIYQEDSNEITTSGRLKVAFQYRISNSINGLMIHVALLDSYEQVIFVTGPEDQGINSPCEEGVYNFIVTFPEDLLAPINYRLKLILWSFNLGVSQIYDVNEEIQFLPIETHSLINNNPGGRSGLIAIKCDWDLQLNI
jgi:lipopolysaccharide transport system ATP-binding protein